MYEPREDSYLLQKYVQKHAHGVVLDVGVGTGIQAEAAARKERVSRVVGVDIDPAAITYCKNTHTDRKFTFIVSDLFARVPKLKFDTIIFNPPYLPADPREVPEYARALSGGKKGYELLERFLSEARSHLNDKGIMLILFSSLTNKNMVDLFIENSGFVFEELGTEKYSMEELYCYKIMINPALIELRKKGVSSIAYLAHGKRGTIFTGKYRGKKVAVKLKRNDSEAVGRVKNEARWLSRLKNLRFMPRLLLLDSQYVVYEFINGQFIEDYIDKHLDVAVRRVLVNVLKQCFALDELQVSKEEMHQPYKHIIIGKTIKMIDFERMHSTEKPQNVTQFVQYICSLSDVLIGKGIYVNIHSLRRLAQKYKKFPDLAHLKEIIDELQR